MGRRASSGLHGFLVVDKPAGITSHDVISRVRRALNERRVGHAGTLDPPATGVLVIGVGAATRLLRFVESTSKTYHARIAFGSRTSTLDAEGEIIGTAPTDKVAEDTMRAAMESLTGDIDQIPPMVSAIKIGGERLHQKARRGEDIERPPRRVRIHRFELAAFEAEPQPVADVVVECSAGTYIRSLADDLGVALGTFAHLTSLRRTAVGGCGIERAVPLDHVDAHAILPVGRVLDHLQQRPLSEAEARDLQHGKRIASQARGLALAHLDGRLIAVLDDDGSEARAEVGVPPEVELRI